MLCWKENICSANVPLTTPTSEEEANVRELTFCASAETIELSQLKLFWLSTSFTVVYTQDTNIYNQLKNGEKLFFDVFCFRFAPTIAVAVFPDAFPGALIAAQSRADELQ